MQTLLKRRRTNCISVRFTEAGSGSPIFLLDSTHMLLLSFSKMDLSLVETLISVSKSARCVTDNI